MIKLEHSEKHIDMGIKFIEMLQKDLMIAAGKVKYNISARQIVSIKRLKPISNI